MNEEPPKKQTTQWLYAGLIIFALVFVILVPLALTVSDYRTVGQLLHQAFPEMLLISLVVATLVVGSWAFIRWVCRWKNFQRFLFGCACLATLIAMFYAEEDWRGWHDWQNFKSQWEAKGERFDWASIVPPAVPDDENFAMAPIWVESMKAALGPQNSLPWFGSYAEDGRTNFVDRLNMPITQRDDDGPTTGNGNWRKATLTDLKPWQDYYRKLAATTNQFPVALQPQTPAQDVLLALSKYDSTLDELRQAAQRPDSRFPLDYGQDGKWEILLPHLAELKRCSVLLELRAVAELQNGQSDKALADIQLSFRLIDAVRTEPFLISHLVRIAMLQITLQPIYEGLAERQWSPAQLAEIDSELSKLDFLADYQVVLRGERGLETSAVESFRHMDRRLYNDFIGDMNGNQSQSSILPVLILHLIPSGWLYQNELRVCRFSVTQYLPLVDETNRTVSPAAVRAAGLALRREAGHRTPDNFLEPWLLPDFTGSAKRFAYGQESTDMARVAIALERYRQGTDTYPTSLDLLAPNLINEIPHDIINGEPLHYRRTGDGQFILYSVGWNGRDDGGTVIYFKGPSHEVNNDLGDWVWRYPSN